MQERPDITYPTPWSYVVVGEGESELMAHIERSVAGVEHEKRISRHSESGRYTSIEVTLVVRDEEHRLEVFRALGKSSIVRVVI